VNQALGGAKHAWPYLVALIIAYGVIALVGVLTLRETKDVRLEEVGVVGQ